MTPSLACLIISGFMLGSASHAFAQREFVLNFDGDDAVINEHGNDVISGAVDFFTAACPNQPIRLNAHTDRFGRASDNLRRSTAYGLAAADALIAKGFSPTLIQIHVYGESQPSVTTVDDIRERENRRVSIWLTEAGDKACFGEDE